MKRVLKIIVVMMAVAFIVIQFIRIDRTNPPVDPSLPIEAYMNVPPDVQLVLARSCSDCHSHKTVYPWYAHVAPASWFLRNHIDHGREHMNMSEWGKLSSEKQLRKLDEICDEVRGGEMPMPSYLWIHHEAVLSEADKGALCSWTEAERKKVETNVRKEDAK